MDYTGIKCPICEKEFQADDDIVVCPECGTPHHRECYFSLSHCANEEKHAEGFQFETGKLRKIAEQIVKSSASPAESEPEFSSPDEEARYYEAKGIDDKPDFQSPIFGGMGQLSMDLGENPQIDGIPFDEVIEYVGRDSGSARLLFNLTLIDRLKRLRPNFIVLFFPYIWFFARKMYKVGAAVLACFLILTVAFTNSNTVKYIKSTADLYDKALSGEITVEQFEAGLLSLRENGTGNSYIFEAAPQVISVVLRLVLALFANKWYLQKMKKQILLTREECSSMDEYMAALRRKGGKSIPAAVASVLIFAFVNLLYYAVIYYLL